MLKVFNAYFMRVTKSMLKGSFVKLSWLIFYKSRGVNGAEQTNLDSVLTV